MDDASADGSAPPTGRPTGASTSGFRERVHPGPGLWAAAAGFAVILAIALWPVDAAVAVAAGVLALAGGGAALVATSPVVSVEDGTFRAGRAHIPVALLGTVTMLDPEAMRRQLGPSLDARAFVCLRAWARTGVHVVIEDEKDPTPYWLVSTRRPESLARALGEAASRAGLVGTDS
ncbi:DUF3093 domain-containing protein [Cellulosimicrobium arenosum]|uniref:DUF3093 domain-containing protein n=1 Tax=Cellulosimicrobium arenosum TaxID=2708133 RepID=A0A927G776_9MICO|nr:DUF3093 domain-containing protein [Cellulosimicrobium arenosum]MBD8077975.1 DUF3093 domain-containing protein [Cellulosimicrobium arenosum]